MGETPQKEFHLPTIDFQGRLLLVSGRVYTLPETNIAPKNGWLEYYFPIGKVTFQGLC